MKLAKQLACDGKTVLMVVHDLPHAFSLADEIILMEAGRVADHGTPEEVSRRGSIDRIFGIHFCRSETGNGCRYYCED